MGTGKTAVGRELSRLLGMRVIDVDHEIEVSQGRTVTEIFSELGEEGFRLLEAETIARMASLQGVIISTGGGAVLREDNLNALKRNGFICCLTASPEVILERTAGNKDRPLLESADRKARIVELLAQRRPFYEKAGILVDTDGKTPLQVAEEIIGKVKWKE